MSLGAKEVMYSTLGQQGVVGAVANWSLHTLPRVLQFNTLKNMVLINSTPLLSDPAGQLVSNLCFALCLE